MLKPVTPLYQVALSEDEQANLAAEVAEYEAMVESGIYDDIPAWAMVGLDEAVERHTSMMQEWFS